MNQHGTLPATGPRPDPTIRVKPLRARSRESIVVSPAEFDNMGAILQTLGFPFLQTSDWSEFWRALPSAQIAFINCGWRAAGSIEPLMTCLQRGGVIFASDWAADYLEELGINDLRFHPKCGQSDAANAELVDPELQMHMRRLRVDISFDMVGWVPVEKLPASAQVLLRGDVELGVSPSSATHIEKVPPALSLPFGSGQIFFTSFHNHAQITDLERGLLSFLAIKTVAVASGKTLQQVITERRLSERLRL